jgi:hypothetical protein
MLKVCKGSTNALRSLGRCVKILEDLKESQRDYFADSDCYSFAELKKSSPDMTAEEYETTKKALINLSKFKNSTAV